MKVTRQKKVHKIMRFFCNNYGFRRPYQILIDGTFCFAALKNKFNIKEQIPKYLDGEVKLLTTQCVILETETLGRSVFGAMLVVKQFAVHKCGHNDKPVAGSVCLASMLGENNKSRYIIATQDRELQAVSRKVPGTPLIYLHQKAPTLEQPSIASSHMAKVNCQVKFGVTEVEENILSDLKKEKIDISEEKEKKKKKKKRSGPNPLSCKKKKKSEQERTKQTAIQKKCNRKRLKVPKHVKEHWMALAKEEVNTR